MSTEKISAEKAQSELEEILNKLNSQLGLHDKNVREIEGTINKLEKQNPRDPKGDIPKEPEGLIEEFNLSLSKMRELNERLSDARQKLSELVG